MTIRAASAGMGTTLWTLPLSHSGFNVAVAVLGGFLSTFGLVSYLLKEHYYLPEARELRPRVS
jgi:hypothetical protein